MTSPACTVNSTVTTNGVNVASGGAVSIALANPAGVNVWTISCVNTDDLQVAATITAGMSTSQITHISTLTAPVTANGAAMIFQSQVNNGKGINGQIDPTLTTTFAVFVLASSGIRVCALNQIYEGSAAFGWMAALNAAIRTAGSSTVSSLTFPASDATPTISQTLTAVNSATGFATVVQAQNATGTAATGGALNLTSGTGTSVAGAVNVQTGGITAINVTPGNITLCDAGGVSTCLASVQSAASSGLAFGNGCTSIVYKQTNNTTNSATGSTTTIQAQNATGTSATGGALVLTSGTGTTTAGGTILQCGGVTKLTCNGNGITFATQALDTINTATPGASVTFDFSLGSIQAVTLGANITTLTLSNMKAGGQYTLSFIQGGAGGFTVTAPGTMKLAGGAFGAWSATGKRDTYCFWSDGTNLYEKSRALNV